MKFLADLANKPASLGSTWAIARSAVAGAPLFTLLSNAPQEIFPSSRDLAEQGRCEGLAGYLVACVVENGQYGWTAHLVLIAIFAAVASGFAPVITGPAHVYAAMSYMNVLGTIDGGEQAALVFSVWALPICLVDWRPTHWKPWSEPDGPATSTMSMLRQSTVHVFTFVMKIQVSFIYLQACLSKLTVSEWADGTAFYYWTIDGYLPPPSIFGPLVAWASTTPALVLAATYGALVLEFTLGISLFIRAHKIRRSLWLTTMLFHFMIGATFGIWSFSLVMTALATFLLSPARLSDWWKDLKSPQNAGSLELNTSE